MQVGTVVHNSVLVKNTLFSMEGIVQLQLIAGLAQLSRFRIDTSQEGMNCGQKL